MNGILQTPSPFVGEGLPASGGLGEGEENQGCPARKRGELYLWSSINESLATWGDSLNKRLGASEEGQWCPQCGKYVEAVRLKTNNLMVNLLLSVLTMGIWLIVWVCTADLSTRKPYQCPACGTRTQEIAVDATDNCDSPTNGSK
jgi:uncharacterized protein (UPF0212 family)